MFKTSWWWPLRVLSINQSNVTQKVRPMSKFVSQVLVFQTLWPCVVATPIQSTNIAQKLKSKNKRDSLDVL